MHIRRPDGRRMYTVTRNRRPVGRPHASRRRPPHATPQDMRRREAPEHRRGITTRSTQRRSTPREQTAAGCADTPRQHVRQGYHICPAAQPRYAAEDVAAQRAEAQMCRGGIAEQIGRAEAEAGGALQRLRREAQRAEGAASERTPTPRGREGVRRTPISHNRVHRAGARRASARCARTGVPSAMVSDRTPISYGDRATGHRLHNKSVSCGHPHQLRTHPCTSAVLTADVCTRLREIDVLSDVPTPHAAVRLTPPRRTCTGGEVGRGVNICGCRGFFVDLPR